jgi:hypothetical protein
MSSVLMEQTTILSINICEKNGFYIQVKIEKVWIDLEDKKMTMIFGKLKKLML